MFGRKYPRPSVGCILKNVNIGLVKGYDAWFSPRIQQLLNPSKSFQEWKSRVRMKDFKPRSGFSWQEEAGNVLRRERRQQVSGVWQAGFQGASEAVDALLPGKPTVQMLDMPPPFPGALIHFGGRPSPQSQVGSPSRIDARPVRKRAKRQRLESLSRFIFFRIPSCEYPGRTAVAGRPARWGLKTPWSPRLAKPVEKLPGKG